MASLYFNYSTMNAGKSSQALQCAYNYEERGMRVRMFKPGVDTRDGNQIYSRIGLSRPCEMVEHNKRISHMIDLNDVDDIACIIVDEAQFLTYEQVKDLASIVDEWKIPVMCYGLRTDFMGKLFEGSKALFELADKLQEIKTICHCGSRATMVLRVDENHNVLRHGDQIQVGGNESYVSVCRRHWMSGDAHKC